MASKHVLDRSLKMVDLLNSTQRCKDLLPNYKTVTLSYGQVVDERVENKVNIDRTNS